METLRIKLVISIILFIIGLTLLWINGGFLIALGVFLLIWANNITNSVQRILEL